MFNDFKFRCHYLSDFTSTSSEEKNNPYNLALREREKCEKEILNLKTEKSIQTRRDRIVELNIEIEHLKEEYANKVYLSKTAVNRLCKIARELKYGIVENLDNKYLQKGIMVEDESISTWSKVSNRFLKKNEKLIIGDIKQGTPDIISKFEGVPTIEDIKSSFKPQTFDNTTTLPKSNYWQLQAYMDLANVDLGLIVYVLSNTPVELILAEVRSLAWQHFKEKYKNVSQEDKMSMEDFIMWDEDFNPIKTQIFRNHTYNNVGYIERLSGQWDRCNGNYWEELTIEYNLSDFDFKEMPDVERVRVFKVKRNQERIVFLNKKLIEAKSQLINFLEDKRGLEIIELEEEMCNAKEGKII